MYILTMLVTMSRSSRSPTPPCTSTLPIDIGTKTGTSLPDDDMPIQSRGGYTIDFDNLDTVNPFQSSSNMILSPPKPATELSDTLTLTESALPTLPPTSEEETADVALDGTLPFIPSVENSLADLSTDGTSTDSTVIIQLRNTPLSDHHGNETVNIEDSEPAPVVHEGATDSLLPPKGSYQIDFDNLDSVNPFKTVGSKIQNSPVSLKSPVGDSAPPKAEEITSGIKNQETPTKQEEKPCTTEMPGPTEVNVYPSVAPPKEAPMLLEFNFDDGAEVKRKPPPKRLGLKRPPLSKTKEEATKPASASSEKKSPVIKPKSCDAATDSTVTEIPPARGAYTIDFDQFDDPNFNPFGTKVVMGSSSHDVPVVSKDSTSPAQPENQESILENPPHR